MKCIFLISKMLMGVDIEGISIIVFVRVLNMLHYVVQGKSSNHFKLDSNLFHASFFKFN